MPKAVSTFILAHGLSMALNHVDKSSLVENLANDLDKLMDDKLGGKSEGLQRKMCAQILLPLTKELMKEDHHGWKELLIQFAEPYRGSGLEQNESGGASGPRQNFSPKRG